MNINELVSLIDGQPDEAKEYQLNDPIARRMFCLQGDWKSVRRRGTEGRIPPSLKEVVLSRSPGVQDL